MDYLGRVGHFISLGTMSDLVEMSELALELTIEKDRLNRERLINNHKYETVRASGFIELKSKDRLDGKKYSEKQIDVISKDKALKYLDPEVEADYWKISSLLDRLLEKRIEITVINKYERELVSK